VDENGNVVAVTPGGEFGQGEGGEQLKTKVLAGGNENGDIKVENS
jgi:hypothetical protein